MADFACRFIDSPGVLFVGQPDGQNYNATIMPFAVIADLLRPTVTLLSPASLSVQIDPDTSITFRVQDDRLLRRAYLWVEYADSSSEMIYRDGEFLAAFEPLSSAIPVGDPTDSVEFTVARGIDINGARVGGWPSSPRIFVGGIDSSGNVT